MSNLQYRIALATIYFAFAIFVLSCLLIVASVTVIPMYQNYREHGSIFLAHPQGAHHAQQ